MNILIAVLCSVLSTGMSPGDRVSTFQKAIVSKESGADHVLVDPRKSRLIKDVAQFADFDPINALFSLFGEASDARRVLVFEVYRELLARFPNRTHAI